MGGGRGSYPDLPAQAATPVDDVGLNAGHVDVGYDPELGLQQLHQADVGRIAGKLALPGIEQAVAMVTEVDLVERHTGRDRRSGHHLGHGGQNARVVLGLVDMVDGERFGDVAEAHVRRLHVHEFALSLRGDGLRIDVVRDHRSRRPDEHDDARVFERGLDPLRTLA